MRSHVVYEWDAQVSATVDGPEYYADEVIDHDFRDTLAEIVRACARSLFRPHDGTTADIMLIRHLGNNDDGEKDRQWAYLNDDGTLPEYFTRHRETATETIEAQGAKIPQRFHAEARKAQRNTAGSS